MAGDWILALDTSTPTASVAVLCPETSACSQRVESAQTHGPTVLVLIEQVLAEAGIAPQDLAGVACGRGPGSFTGLRIGLATAKGICFALDVPLLLPSPLEALARATRRTGPAVIVSCVDARRQEIFASAFAFGDGDATPREILPPAAGGPDALAARLRDLDTATPPILVGNGAALYRDRLIELLGDRAEVPEDAPRTPDAAVLAEMAATLLARGEVADLRRAEPEYIRPSDAELTRDKRLAAEAKAAREK